MRRVDWNAEMSSDRTRSLVSPRMRRVDWNSDVGYCRTPPISLSSHEESGLKYSGCSIKPWRILVSPRMRRVDWNIRGLEIVSDDGSLSSHEESGLKFLGIELGLAGGKSLLAWGEWIEISSSLLLPMSLSSLLAWGEWIEIDGWTARHNELRLSSHEESGLK